MNIVKPKQYFWITPKGSFNCPEEASTANGCSAYMVRHRCNNLKDGYYKVIHHLEELTCSSCGVTHPLDKKLLRSDMRAGKRYFSSECLVCQRKRDKSDKRTKPYVYRFLDESGSIVYVGKTFQLDRRIRRHFNEKPLPWKTKFKGTIEIAEMANSADMNIMEMYLISIWSPEHNKSDNYGDLTTYKLPVPTFTLHKEIE